MAAVGEVRNALGIGGAGFGETFAQRLKTKCRVTGRDRVVRIPQIQVASRDIVLSFFMVFLTSSIKILV
jgi:hypothetical protein